MRVAYIVLLSVSILLLSVFISIIYLEFAQEGLVDFVSTTTTTTTETPSINCPIGGVWSEWTVTGPCPTTCGSCSVASRVRMCAKTCGDCPCTGPSVDVGPCGLDLCLFPSPVGTCCKPFKKSINYQTRSFFCGTESISGIAEIKCHA